MARWTEKAVERVRKSIHTRQTRAVKGPRPHKIFVGIDSGVKTGIGVWSKLDKAFLHMHTEPIDVAMKMVEAWKVKYGAAMLVRVEDARKATYGRQQDGHRLRGAGSVMRDAKVWQDFLTRLGVDFEMVRPNKGLSKLDVPTFTKITGYTGRTSEHCRDAAMLVYGY